MTAAAAAALEPFLATLHAIATGPKPCKDCVRQWGTRCVDTELMCQHCNRSGPGDIKDFCMAFSDFLEEQSDERAALIRPVLHESRSITTWDWPQLARQKPHPLLYREAAVAIQHLFTRKPS